MPDPLVVFLTAQLDERERIARAAYAGPWRYNPNKVWNDPPVYGQPQRPGEEYVAAGPLEQPACIAATGPADHRQSMDDARHIALHDPAAALADVASKRLILSMHRPDTYLGESCVPCMELDADQNHIPWPCPTMRALATAFRHADGYRAEWAYDA